MDKILTAFVRNPQDMRLVTREVTPGCEWAIAGEGVPTVKRDGTNVRVDIKAGKIITMWKRKNPTREEKAAGAEPGYTPINPDDPADKHMLDAIKGTDIFNWPDGEWPCEALGPKIQGGVEMNKPTLYPFKMAPELLTENPRTFDELKAFFEKNIIEGIVWHHEDGRMAKIKRRDFGLEWKQNPQWREAERAKVR